MAQLPRCHGSDAVVVRLAAGVSARFECVLIALQKWLGAHLALAPTKRHSSVAISIQTDAFDIRQSITDQCFLVDDCPRSNTTAAKAKESIHCLII